MATIEAAHNSTLAYFLSKEDQALVKELLEKYLHTDQVKFNSDDRFSKKTSNVVQLLNAVAEGHNVTAFSFLTVKQASDFLDMEENNLLELLRSGMIAQEIEGEQLVLADSLLRYKTEMKKGQKRALEDMAAENQRLGLYD